MVKKRPPPSPAQRANQITFTLKGHLKNVQISFLRVANLLAQIRDQRLFAALKFDSMQSYARQRLRLGRASTYRYLQIHDWVRENQPGWLAKKPKGFIPELSEVYSIMSIDHWLEAPGLDDDTRRDLEKARKQALAGELTEADFRKLRVRAVGETPPLRALLSSLHAARKRARAIPSLPVTVLTELDALIARIQAMGDVTEQVAKLVGSRRAPRRDRKSLVD